MNDQNFNNQNVPYQPYQAQPNPYAEQAPQQPDPYAEQAPQQPNPYANQEWQQPNPYANQEWQQPNPYMAQGFQQNPYGDPNFTPEPVYDPEVVAAGEKKGKIAKILGLISMILSFFCGGATSIGLSIASLIIGGKARAIYPEASTGKGMAITGIILGAIGAVVCYVVLFIYYIIIFAAEGLM